MRVVRGMAAAVTFLAAGAVSQCVAVVLDPSAGIRSVWFVLFSSVLILHALIVATRIPAAYDAIVGEGRLAGSRVIWATCLLLFTTAAIIVYRPTLRLGLLADDFTLLYWAQELRLLPRNWEYVRPLPFLLWSAIALVTPPAALASALHLLNVLLHALNGWLAARLAQRVGTSLSAAIFAGALFLLYPAVVEPVAWCSGVFDVLLGTFVLALCLTVTRRPRLSRAGAACGVVIGFLMITCKETGVVAAPLALLAAWTGRRHIDGRRLVLVAALVLESAAYTAWRMLSHRLDPRLTPEVDADALRRLFLQSFGTLSVPLHADVTRAHPFLAAAVGVLLIALLVLWMWRWPSAPAAPRLAILAALSVIITVAPTIRPFWIDANLQGTRYIYVAAVMWSIALASALVDHRRSRIARLGSLIAAAAVLMGAAAAVKEHLEPWKAARRARDVVLLRLVDLPVSCETVYAPGVPDNVAGAFVFRNGLTEAAASVGRQYRFVKREEDAPPECRVDLSGDVINREIGRSGSQVWSHRETREIRKPI